MRPQCAPPADRRLWRRSRARCDVLHCACSRSWRPLSAKHGPDRPRRRARRSGARRSRGRLSAADAHRSARDWKDEPGPRSGPTASLSVRGWRGDRRAGVGRGSEPGARPPSRAPLASATRATDRWRQALGGHRPAAHAARARQLRAPAVGRSRYRRPARVLSWSAGAGHQPRSAAPRRRARSIAYRPCACPTSTRSSISPRLLVLSPSVCSWNALALRVRPSSSRPSMRRPLPASASSSRASHWPSSWPPRGSRCSPPSRSPIASTIASTCSPMDVRPGQRATARWRVALDWSFLLLEAPERAVLRRMAVFADGATADAVQYVCAANPADKSDALDGMARLVDQSLVTIADHGDVPRYRLLEPVRQYALQRLRAAGEEADTSETDTQRSSCRPPKWPSQSCLDRRKSSGSNDWNASFRTFGWPSIGTSTSSGRAGAAPRGRGVEVLRSARTRWRRRTLAEQRARARQLRHGGPQQGVARRIEPGVRARRLCAVGDAGQREPGAPPHAWRYAWRRHQPAAPCDRDAPSGWRRPFARAVPRQSGALPRPGRPAMVRERAQPAGHDAARSAGVRGRARGTGGGAGPVPQDWRYPTHRQRAGQSWRPGARRRRPGSSRNPPAAGARVLP